MAAGLDMAMAPKYEWHNNEMTAHVKYGVRKGLAKYRFRKPTKKQLAMGQARRAQQAALGLLPARQARRAVLPAQGS